MQPPDQWPARDAELHFAPCRRVHCLSTETGPQGARPAGVVGHIPDRATLQVGIGGINDAILGSLPADHARALIAIAHPDHREALEREARIVRT